MSLTKEKRHFKCEMPSGVHLASIFDIKLYKDSVSKQPIIKDDEMGLIITFWTTNADKQNLYHEQVYWVGKGNAGREKYLTQMLLDAGVDMSVTPMDVKLAKNKRLWIAIREVYTLINNGEEVKKDMLGNDVIEKFIFQTAPIFDVDRVPTWKGDPKFNDGIACDEFVGYKEGDAEDGYATMPQGTGESFTLEVAPVTPEVEKAVVEKPKKEKKVKMEVKVVAGNNPELLDNAHTITTTPMPNFGEATPTEEQKVFIVKEITNNISHVNGVDVQTVNTTPLPNFGDNETPDTNF